MEEEGIYILQKATCKSPFPKAPQPSLPTLWASSRGIVFLLPPLLSLFAFFCFLMPPAEQFSSLPLPCLSSNQTLGMLSPSQGLIKVFSYSKTLSFLRGIGVSDGCVS